MAKIARRAILLAAPRVAAMGLLLPYAKRSQVPAPPVSTAANGLLPPQVTELERLIPQLMKDAVVPGVSVALVQEGRIAWRRGFGVKDRTSQTPVDDHTVFEAASVSKTVFAYAVMKLCDKGTLGIDTPLTKYTPDRILESDARLDVITARHVLSHTSGLPNWRSSHDPLRISFPPGERYLYSGEGYYYLQSVVSRLTGQSDRTRCGRYEADLAVCATDFDAYMKANILAPFDMTDSGYVWTTAMSKTAAQPHGADGQVLAKGRPTSTDVARYGAAGGLHTTATDYAKFLLELIDPRPSDAFRLAKDRRADMLRPQVKVDESTSWALGWQVRHTPRGNVVQHQGGQDGFQAFTAASTDRRRGFVIFTNSANGWKVFYDEKFSHIADDFLLGSASPLTK